MTGAVRYSFAVIVISLAPALNVAPTRMVEYERSASEEKTPGTRLSPRNPKKRSLQDTLQKVIYMSRPKHLLYIQGIPSIGEFS